MNIIICSKCGIKNPDEAKYCQECGFELKKTFKVPKKELKKVKESNKGKSSNTGLYAFLGIIGIIVLLFGLSLIVSQSPTSPSTVSNVATYSGNGVSFSYPSDFNDTKVPGSITGDESWKNLAFKSNGRISISLNKNSNYTDPQSLRDSAVSSAKQYSGGDALSSTTETNAQGVKIFKAVTTINDPSSNQKLRYYHGFFTVSGQVYLLTVYGKDGDSQIEKVANQVFNSLTLTN